VSGPTRVGELLAARSVDPIARLAEAWNLEGRHPFAISGREHRALLAMAGLDQRLVAKPWNRLEEYQRQALLVAARQAVDLGRACAWVFGEGQGA
jgi:hypothetical protein